ncbi:hypothetical protein BDA96_01G124200 [Sorghum bicolor]|uniref:Plantacyanin n=2 Tax=Sorghum bicolor TaxID=4558 RepID=A0A921RZC4_SORBI|nr:basic blue protein [Sorghum bicolor]EER91007.1 hypothetical protein SORBI_3001G119200 [Sorghum bicolor]KAG0547942.1 hypothetical protein BDA96_01G124200 [Sorghum bicolor]|eukprot:XP_002464009.1 basic blue protein [Sorghum bicolor]
MAQGRGGASAGRAIGAMAFAAVACCCCVVIADAATTYYVGDSNGWSFSSPSWPNGKHFRAGDTLVFRYIPWIHNVVAVSEDGYNGCTTPPGSRTYTSGADSVTLAKGDNFFICTRFGHCNLGMKLVVYAA